MTPLGAPSEKKGDPGRLLLPPEADAYEASAWSAIRLRKLMQFTLLTREALAERLSVSLRALGYWLSGKKVPDNGHRRLLDRFAQETGFLAKEQAGGMLPWFPKGVRPKRRLARMARKRRGTYADLPIGAS